jgi:hypothetical protein
MPQYDYAKVIARAWSDSAYRQRLISDPRKTLNDEGWDLDPSVHVEIKPDSDATHIVLGLPQKPSGLADHELSQHAHEMRGCCCCC